jgi:hypothetical protein
MNYYWTRTPKAKEEPVKAKEEPKVEGKVKCKYCGEYYSKRGIYSHEKACKTKEK